MFVTALDRDQHRVNATICGSFSGDEGRAFAMEVQQRIVHQGWQSGSYCVLIDATDFLPQPQPIAASIQDVIVHSPVRARKIAIASSSTLARLQLRRILPDRNVGFFDTLPEALNWLDEPAD